MRRLLVVVVLVAAACSNSGGSATQGAPLASQPSTVPSSTVAAQSTTAPSASTDATSASAPPATAEVTSETATVTEVEPDGLVRVTVPAGLAPAAGSSAVFITEAEGAAWFVYSEEAGRAWSWVASLAEGELLVEFEPPAMLWRDPANTTDPYGRDVPEPVVRPEGRYEIRLGDPNMWGVVVAVVDLPEGEEHALEPGSPVVGASAEPLLEPGGIAGLAFGTEAAVAVELLAERFGPPDDSDAEYRDGCVGPSRTLVWSAIGLRVTLEADRLRDPDADPVLSGWELRIIDDERSQPFTTADGIGVGMAVSELTRLVRPVFGVNEPRVGTRFFEFGDAFELSAGGVLDGDFTDPSARIVALSSPSPAGSC